MRRLAKVFAVDWVALLCVRPVRSLLALVYVLCDCFKMKQTHKTNHSKQAQHVPNYGDPRMSGGHRSWLTDKQSNNKTMTLPYAFKLKVFELSRDCPLSPARLPRKGKPFGCGPPPVAVLG